MAAKLDSIRSSDLKRLEVFDHRCLRSIAHIGWSNRISNADVRRRVSGEELESSLEFSITSHRLRWLGHVLRMPAHRLLSRILHAVPHTLWRRRPGGQITTWQKEMRELVDVLICSRPFEAPGLGTPGPT